MTARGFARLKLRMLSAWPYTVRLIEEAGWGEWQDALAEYDDQTVDTALTSMRDALGDRYPSLSVLLGHVRVEAARRRPRAVSTRCRCHEVGVDDCEAFHPDGWREEWLAAQEAYRIVEDHMRRNVPIDPTDFGSRAQDIWCALFAYRMMHPATATSDAGSDHAA